MGTGGPPGWGAGAPGQRPAAGGPIQDRIQNDAAAQAAWAAMGSPGGGPDILAANAAHNANVTSAAVRGWGPASRAAYPNARADNSNLSFINSGMRANASYENQERDRINRQTRQEADYERRDRDLAQIRVRRMAYEQQQEAVYENRDHDLARAKERRDEADMRRNANYENRDNDLRYRSTRQAADYENRDRNMSYDQMRKQADYENAAFDRANNPPGGGGGGGGRGGGGLPGVMGGWFGMRNTGSALGGGGFSAAIAAEIGREIYFAPQTIAGFESSWLGKTGQARSYIDQTSVMGQSGGFNSRDFRSNLRAATERGGDDWLLRNGLGADEAAQMVANLGVVPRSVEQATNAARQMANSRTTPGISGVPAGALTGMLRDMLGIGATTLDRMPSMTNDIGAIMKQTAQTGQDQLKVLRSIDTGVVSLSTAPGASTAIGPDTLFQANQRFISTPAGMVGVAGAESISSTQSAFGTVGNNPARTIVASTMVEKLKTEGDLRAFFGGDAWDTFVGSPVGRELADTYLRDIKAGHKYGAMATFSKGLMQDPTLAASVNAQNAMISNPITNQYGSGQAGLTLATQANMSNMTEAQVVAFNQSLKQGQASGLAANNPLNLTAANQPGLIGAKKVADGQNIGVFSTMAAGIGASVNQLREYEKNGLMTPRELVMKWSGGHASEAYVRSVADSIGVSPDTKVNMNYPDVARAYVQGAQPFESGPGRVSKADINSGIDLAFGRKGANPNLREDGTPDPNVPDYNPAVGTAKSDVLHSGSERTLRQGENLNDRVNQISDSWRMIVFAVDGLATAVRAAATVQGSTPLNTLH